MGRKSRTPRRDAGRARGPSIVDAMLTQTLVELASAGMAGLSVERIARRAQVNKTSVYRRWPSREALVAAALEGVLASTAAAIPDTGSLRGDLLGLLMPVVRLLESPSGQAVARVVLGETSAEAIGKVGARQLGLPSAAPLRALVARAKARNEWRAGVTGEHLVFVLVGAILHRAMLERAPLSKRWVEATVDLVLGGVLPRR